MAQKLYRDSENKVFFGVCSGLANYLNVDPIIIRLLFVVLFFAGGSSFLAYLIAVFVIPKRPYFVQQFNNDETNSFQEFYQQYDRKSNNNKPVIFGSLFIVMGLFFLINNFISIQFQNFYPVLMIVIGSFIIYNSFNKIAEAE